MRNTDHYFLGIQVRQVFIHSLTITLLLCLSNFVVAFIPTNIKAATIRDPIIQVKRFRMSTLPSKDSSPTHSTVQIYSSKACRYCRIAKATLKRYQIQAQDFDIHEENHSNTIIDETSANRLVSAKSSTVPQIYVGDIHIGGCDNLLAKISSGDFFQLLNDYNVDYNAIAISSPDALEDSEGQQSSTNAPSSSSPYLNCLPPSTFGNNEATIDTVSTVDSNIIELSRQLQLLSLSMVDKFMSDDGRFINYRAMSASQEFRQYIAMSSTLATIDVQSIQSLSDGERLSLFVNLYNSMIIHANCIVGPPANTPESRTAYFNGQSGARYNISGWLFSPDDIEHGILRCNRAKNGLFGSYFFELNMDDPRAVFSLSHFDFRLHFILNCGARSCPPIRVLTGDLVEDDRALNAAAAAYVQSEVRVDLKTGILWLPRLALWYSRDFGSDLESQLETLLGCLSSTLIFKHQLLQDIDAISFAASSGEIITGNQNASATLSSIYFVKHIRINNLAKSGEERFVKVQYNPYDWNINSL